MSVTKKADRQSPTLPGDEESYQLLMSLLKENKRNDFALYKPSTIRRRMYRRMSMNNKHTIIEYLEWLKQYPAEQDALYQDLLIPVTSFFRDEPVFHTLCSTIFPALLLRKQGMARLRIWVAGCSTGQEAYSLAICMKELADPEKQQVQLFATDISETAIDKARKGVYSMKEMAGVSAARIKKFFIPVKGGYQVSKELRDHCIFARHNFLQDPPFGKMDIVSCRNVLIYMQPYLQKKALHAFHYSLCADGFLLLGKSETGGTAPDLFHADQKAEKIFVPKNSEQRFPRKHPAIISPAQLNYLSTSKEHTMQPDFQKLTGEMLHNFIPPAVVVNESFDIVFFKGDSSRFLSPSPGKPTHNIIRMAREGLGFELRNLLGKAIKTREKASKENVMVHAGNSTVFISIDAIPIPAMSDPHFLIVFREMSRSINTGMNDLKDQLAINLEKELLQARQDMLAVSQEQEAANEELQSANEELLSSSEELQSMNEELETSKEELETTNEELMLVNQELMEANKQLTRARDFAEAIISTVRTPLLVLDESLRILTANTAFTSAFQLASYSTKGKLIYELGEKQWDLPDLKKLLEEILPAKSNFADFKVTASFAGLGERVMLLNAREISYGKNDPKLILLSIDDITEQEILHTKEKNFKEQLELSIDEQTMELKSANEELQEKNNSLQRLNKELESFTYISSHDLQEPLRKIQTFTNRIATKEIGTLSADAKDYFARIQHAAMRMQALIEDLLAYSKTNSGENLLIETDIGDLIEDIKKELTETIKDKEAIIVADVLCPARINPARFRQVLSNLLTNALKFSKQGIPPRIIIQSKTGEGKQLQGENPLLAEGSLLPEKDYCHISVADNGIGFDPQYKDLIFDVFQRLYGKDEYPGTGIGLAIVKKIVTNHQGFVTAKGVENEGATFEIYIPHSK